MIGTVGSGRGEAAQGNRQERTILIVGDWFVDQNWLMARCTRYSSTNPGEFHYESLVQGPDSNITSLCGAASVIRIFRGKDNSGYEVAGVGAWHPNDDELIQCMLCGRGAEEMSTTPYTLAGLERRDEQSGGGERRDCHFDGDLSCSRISALVNLNSNLRTSSECATNRIHRVYEGFGSETPKLRYRFDWVKDLKASPPDVSGLEGHEVDAVVLVDHGKGVVTDQMIEALHRRYESIPWYARTKLYPVSWMKKLKDLGKPLRMLVADEQLMRHRYGARSWRHLSEPSRVAVGCFSKHLGLSERGDAARASRPYAEMMAILFEDDTALMAGSGASGGGHQGASASIVNVASSPGENYPIKVGRTSVFFASLVDEDLQAGFYSEEGLDMQTALQTAVRRVHKWTELCSADWQDSKPSALSGPFPEVLGWCWENDSVPSTFDCPFDVCAQRWTEAETEAGDVGEGDNGRELQLWRASGVLDDYICLAARRRNAISDLVVSIDEYRRDKSPRTPFSFLLLAEPGWGKTYLARKLAEKHDMEFIELSLAQMPSAQHLVKAFDEIVTVQHRTRRRVLVFMDEVDAPVDGNPALGLLLGPMWGGEFRVEGALRRMEPSVWAFASTKPLRALQAFPKGRDFLSRINGPTVNLDWFEDVERESLHNVNTEEQRLQLLESAAAGAPEICTELVYHYVNALRRCFGPLEQVSMDTLTVFRYLVPIDGLRSVDVLASRFRHVSGGKVSLANLPDLEREELKRHIRVRPEGSAVLERMKERGIDESAWVQIQFRPG